MSGTYSASVRSVAAPQFNEEEISGEIEWGVDGEGVWINLVLYPDGDSRSGKIWISSEGVERGEDDRVFAPENRVEDLSSDPQELAVRCFIPDALDGMNIFYIPLTDDLHSKLEQELE